MTNDINFYPTSLTNMKWSFYCGGIILSVALILSFFFGNLLYIAGLEFILCRLIAFYFTGLFTITFETYIVIFYYLYNFYSKHSFLSIICEGLGLGFVIVFFVYGIILLVFWSLIHIIHYTPVLNEFLFGVFKEDALKTLEKERFSPTENHIECSLLSLSKDKEKLAPLSYKQINGSNYLSKYNRVYFVSPYPITSSGYLYEVLNRDNINPKCKIWITKELHEQIIKLIS